MAFNAYYGGYPATFYPTPMMNTPTPQNAPTQVHNASNNGIVWVQGEEAAKAYLVAPNSSVQLWDSEAQTIYIKSADASGMPSMRILDWTERTAKSAKAEASPEYITRAEFETLNAKVENLEKINAEARENV